MLPTTLAIPTAAPETFPTVKLSTRSNADNLDILTPNEAGDLVRSTDSLKTRQQPGEVTYIGDGKCQSSEVNFSSGTCALFCTTQTIVASGASHIASADINCQSTACSVSVTQSVTVSNSFTINGNVGGNGGSNLIKAQAQLGASYTWATTATTANAYSFTPVKGDVGHIIFIPYVLEACGTFTEFFWDVICMDWSHSYDVFNQPINFDPMSCGQTPVTLDNGAAHGVSYFRESYSTTC
jgi:hypothetical protein